MREDTEREIILTKALEIHFINMVKYREQARKNKQEYGDPLYRWLAWLDKTSSPELLEEVVNMDTTIKTADERLEHVTQDEEDMWAYTRYMMGECDRTAELNYAQEKGVEIGIEKGIEKGVEKSNKYFLELLDQGLSPEEIKRRLSQN